MAADQGLINLLTDASVNNLNNSGFPFSGDFGNTAFQWDQSVPANNSMTVQSMLRAQPAPEPGSLLLVGVVAAGAVARCQRFGQGFRPGT